MHNRFTTLLIGLSCFLILGFKPETRYIKKAAKNVERGNIKRAKNYYAKALEKNPESYEANLGMGLLLCELLDSYSESTPYLEKALTHSGKDTMSDLLFALGKCYQNNSEFEKALSYFSRLGGVVDLEGEMDFQKELKKRKEDCNYAIHNHNQIDSLGIIVVNAGRKINSDMPEYVPVLSPYNELIFTSKRKDDEKEEVNFLDAKYYESMYITRMDSTGFGKTRRYTLPDQAIRSRFRKNHESVISISQDNKKLFTYYEGKLYEIPVEERAKLTPKRLMNSVPNNQYQNHAYVTRDGKTLYFTSEIEGGLGGNDIYTSTKLTNGEWSKPENLGDLINTAFDEEAPFLSPNDSILYFASKGHPGFGNFDMYKSKLVGGKWSKPENLGKPLNSPGHDIFLILDTASANGYFSSSRNGGFGDMDIYKIININKINRQCPNYNLTPITFNILEKDTVNFKLKIEAQVPSNYKLLSSEWKANDESLLNTSTTLSHQFAGAGDYRLYYKLVAICDTCVIPIISCNETSTHFEKPKVITQPESYSLTPVIVDVSKLKGVLSADQMASIGFNNNAILFDFNKSTIREDALGILNANLTVLKKYSNLRIQIIGYSDARGSETRNNVLSSERAKTVKTFFTKNGLRSSQIKSLKGLGSQNPVVDCGIGANCDEAAHQQNRRVVFILIAN